ncbi:lysophospholipid acyltransferase family protein [Mycolicibacterium stellerae]|uniref:lysophospholipid acyltransferase family protein n=1 Tax=Mycolicibacterium stellerae TaxID=2358193 RepID=UPI000F0B1A29|nr:lysophospholipid acyltransferase family protein [Mycolicibacterium stellerae]
MSDAAIEKSDVGRYDPGLTETIVGLTRPIVKTYFRSEVRGIDNIPAGPCLVVGNHSGGLLTPDMSVFAVAYYDEYGYDRPLYTLAHDLLFDTPAAALLRRTGVIRATRENAAAGLAAGAAVMVFPGGDHEVYRSTLRRNKIAFGGRTGYVSTAIEAGVPIVPAVSVGAQETQLFLARGEWLSRRLGLAKLSRKVGRSDILPITFGFPFGLSIFTIPLNMPLPSKIVTQVLPPIDIAARFGKDPDVHDVDRYVRWVMQSVLDTLGRRRRLPIFG